METRMILVDIEPRMKTRLDSRRKTGKETRRALE
jgi:hypothetical protein